MAKEGELWDDSALINAFNNAISKYKKMHGQRGDAGEKGKFSSTGDEDVSAVDDSGQETRREVATDVNSNVDSNANLGTGENDHALLIEENHHLESGGSKSRLGSSSVKVAQDEAAAYSNTEILDDYNQLLNKYYEVEDQRQKILQQLNQYGHWDYQNSAPVAYASQEHEAAQAPYPAVSCLYCQYGCQGWTAPCNSLPASCSDGTCVSKPCKPSSSAAPVESSISAGDHDFVKTAMVAAEVALSSLKEQTSGGPDVLTTEGTEIENGLVTRGSTSNTDLTIVLNAWYSAGFYTGKYLTEQSLAKKRHN